MRRREAHTSKTSSVAGNGEHISAGHLPLNQKTKADFIGEISDPDGEFASSLPPSAPNGLNQDPKTGKFLPGHFAALSHGLDSERLPAEYEHLQSELREFVNDCLSDEGDISNISRRRRAQLDYRAILHRRIQQLHAAIEIKGQFDKRGKLRVAWLQRLEGLIGSARQLDAMLGLQRQAKQVRSLADVMQEDL